MRGFYPGQQFAVDAGEDYLVFALSFDIGSNLFGTSTVLHLPDKYGRLTMAPISMFEVVDPKVSGIWCAKAFSDGGMLFGPEEFIDNEYFNQDLAENDGLVRSTFNRLIAAL